MTGLKIENKRNLPQVWQRGLVRTRVGPRGGVGSTLALCLRVPKGSVLRDSRDINGTQESHAAEAATCGNTAIQMLGRRGGYLSSKRTDSHSCKNSRGFRGSGRTLFNCSSYQRVVDSNRDPKRQGGRILLETIQQRLCRSRYTRWRLTC